MCVVFVGVCADRCPSESRRARLQLASKARHNDGGSLQGVLWQVERLRTPRTHYGSGQ